MLPSVLVLRTLPPKALPYLLLHILSSETIQRKQLRQVDLLGGVTCTLIFPPQELPRKSRVLSLRNLNPDDLRTSTALFGSLIRTLEAEMRRCHLGADQQGALLHLLLP